MTLMLILRVSFLFLAVFYALGESYLDVNKEKLGKRINHISSGFARIISFGLIAYILHWGMVWVALGYFLALGALFYGFFDYSHNLLKGDRLGYLSDKGLDKVFKKLTGNDPVVGLLVKAGLILLTLTIYIIIYP